MIFAIDSQSFWFLSRFLCFQKGRNHTQLILVLPSVVWQMFSVRGQIVNILGLGSHNVLITTTDLGKAAPEDMQINGWCCAPVKLHLQKQMVCWIFTCRPGWLTPDPEQLTWSLVLFEEWKKDSIIYGKNHTAFWKNYHTCFKTSH